MPNTPLFNLGFLESLQETFQRDPHALSPQWQDYFTALQTDFPADEARRECTVSEQSPAWRQCAVTQWMAAYRTRGHQRANLDPLALQPLPPVDELELDYHGLALEELNQMFCPGGAFGNAPLALREIERRLRHTYCRTLGIEFMHISDARQKNWLRDKLESQLATPSFDAETKLQILESLTAAEGFEHFLEEQYTGQKRFSLEGGETLIAMLDYFIQCAGSHGAQEIIFGMAHRGRLNVLVNIFGKPTRELFNEFEGIYLQKMHTGNASVPGNGGVPANATSGDVKYHKGHSCDVATPHGNVHLVLAFNPSHLEIIDPVVQGSVRARQDRSGDKLRNWVLPVLIHGDAAFAAQGVVMETLNLSQTRGFHTGGTVHIIINNQIGFTTSDPHDARSTPYCTDVAKMIEAPVFHVNGDDPEMALYAIQLALNFRMEFHRDVVVDLVCYRRKGHNEADEPHVTQPRMYQKIATHPTVVTLYANKLIQEEIIHPEDPQILLQRYRAALKTSRTVARPKLANAPERLDWRRFTGKKWTHPADTAVPLATLARLAERLTRYPHDFRLHRNVEKILQTRQAMGAGQQPLDWGGAEALAYASLVDEGYRVRLCGQDSGRGTFAHRHAELHDQDSGAIYRPLRHISPNQAPFTVLNSPLSEEAVLGFEFGYASSEPDGLTLWEAQFGDFANGAQVVIDQFLASSEAKWQRLCGLTLLLPHGYDGQGPEHSSARLERYLQLCAEDNLQVCAPTTPAQFFHLLRRQILRPYRKPLIIMTPKSLLRDKQATSALTELTQGNFEVVLDEPTPFAGAIENVQRVLLCTGQVYYKLWNYRATQHIDNILIIRLEQLYPFPRREIKKILGKYAHVQQWFWVQEEPINQGAWRFIKPRIPQSWGVDISYAGRLASAAPAAGYMAVHKKQLDELLEQAFDLSYA